MKHLFGAFLNILKHRLISHFSVSSDVPKDNWANDFSSLILLSFLMQPMSLANIVFSKVSSPNSILHIKKYFLEKWAVFDFGLVGFNFF
jgi:hypothetical protein